MPLLLDSRSSSLTGPREKACKGTKTSLQSMHFCDDNNNAHLLEFCSESVPWGWTLANMLVFKRVREALGFQRCKGFGVGAAPIKIETLEYFMSLNIPIRPTYGK